MRCILATWIINGDLTRRSALRSVVGRTSSFPESAIEPIWIVFASFFHRDTDQPTARFFRDSCAWYQRVPASAKIIPRKDRFLLSLLSLISPATGSRRNAHVHGRFAEQAPEKSVLFLVDANIRHRFAKTVRRFESFFCVLRNGFFLLVYGYRKRNCENR